MWLTRDAGRRLALRPLLVSFLLPLAQSRAQSAVPVPKVTRPGVPTPGGPRRVEDLRKQAVFAVAGTPDWSVVAAGSVWVSSARLNHVVKLDATSNTPGLIADVKRPCSGLSAAFGSLWVPSCGDHDLVRLDPHTAKPIATIAADPANSEGGITAGADSIWIVTKPSRLVRIKPPGETRSSQAWICRQAATNVAFGAEAVWITSFDQDRLLRVDPKTMAVTASIAVRAQASLPHRRRPLCLDPQPGRRQRPRASRSLHPG